MSTHLSADNPTDPSAQDAGVQIPQAVPIDPPTFQGPRAKDLDSKAEIPHAFFFISPKVAEKAQLLEPEIFTLVAFTCLYFWAALLSHGILWYATIDDPFIAALLVQAKEQALLRTGSKLASFDFDLNLVHRFAWDGFAYLREYIRMIVRDTFSLNQWDLLSSSPNDAMRIGIYRLLLSYTFSREGLQGLVGTHPVLEKLCFFIYCHPEIGIARAVNFFGVGITPRLVASLAAMIYSALQEYEKGYYSKSLSFYGPYYDLIVVDMQRHMSARQTVTWNKWRVNIMQTKSSNNARNSSTSVHEPPVSSSPSLQEGSLHEVHQAPPATLGPAPSTQPVPGALGASHRHTSRLTPHQNLAPYPDPSDHNLRRNKIRVQPGEDEFRAPYDHHGQDRSAAHFERQSTQPSGSQAQQAGHSQAGVALFHPYAAPMGPPGQTALHHPYPQHTQPLLASLAAPPGAYTAQVSRYDTQLSTTTPALPRSIPIQPPAHNSEVQARAQALSGPVDHHGLLQGAIPAIPGWRPPPQSGVGRPADTLNTQQMYPTVDAPGILFGNHWELDSFSVPITGYHHEHAHSDDNREGEGGWGVPGPSRGSGSNVYSHPVYKTMPRNG